MNNNVSDTIVNAVSFLFSPLLAIPMYCKGIMQQRPSSFYFLGAVFALFGTFLAPSHDAFRYRETYYANEAIDWSGLFVNTKDFLYPLLSITFNNVGCSFLFFRFLLVLMSYSIIIWIFLDILKNNPALQANRNLYLPAMITAFFCVRFHLASCGLRWAPATYIVVLAIYLFYKQQYIKATIVYIGAVSMHISTALILPMIGLAFLMTKMQIKTYIKILVLIVLVLFFNSSLETLLSSVMPGNELVQKNTNAYISGEWGTDNVLKKTSFAGLVFFIIHLTQMFVLCYLVFKKKINSFLSNMCFLLLALLCISFSSLSIVDRYANVGIPCCLLALFSSDLNYQNTMREIRLTMLTFLIIFLSDAYGARNDIRKGCQVQVLGLPGIVFMKDIYSDEWILENVRPDGYFYDFPP
jgi:hypothetical protein